MYMRQALTLNFREEARDYELLRDIFAAWAQRNAGVSVDRGLESDVPEATPEVQSSGGFDAMFEGHPCAPDFSQPANLAHGHAGDMPQDVVVDRTSQLREEDVDDTVWDVQPPPPQGRPFAVNRPSCAQFCHAFMPSHSCDNSERDMPLSAPQPQPADAAPETDEDADDEPDDASFFEVRALPRDERPLITEQDAVKDACGSLALGLRLRPTLPPKRDDFNTPWEDVFSAVRLPLWHCAFKGCGWWGEGEEQLRQHLGASHVEDFERCRALTPHARRYEDMDLYEEAIAIKVGSQITTPALPPSFQGPFLKGPIEGFFI